MVLQNLENLTNAIIESGFSNSLLDFRTGQLMMLKQYAKHCVNSLQ